MSKNTKKSARDNGTYVFSDFSEGLYLIDTPRTLGQQLASLALKGGRNIWSESGSLIPQYGYMPMATLPETERVAAVSKDSKSSSSFFIVTLLGNVYFYTTAQGLKKYKTNMGTTNSDVLLARNNDDLILFDNGAAKLFGAYYSEGEEVVIDSDITVSDYSTFYQFTVPLDSYEYYWNDKIIVVNGKDKMTITSVALNDDSTAVIVRATLDVDVTERPSYSDPVTIGEKALLPIDLIYKPEDSTQSDITITPTLLEVANNRLFAVDISGNIFYSQVGVIDGFEQSLGAGYFGGFYNDSSKCLSLDEYIDGTLICKQNGLYYLTIGDSVTIKKIAQIGQQYATDHVIVRENVYAYDSNSGAIVNAITQNVFGSLTSGKVLIDAEFLQAQDMGIADVKRCLTYNSESNVFILYYGEHLNRGIVVVPAAQTIFPRELDKNMEYFLGCANGVYGVAEDNTILSDFKKGTVIEGLTCIAEFEPIALRDNRMICCSLLEVTELNGINYSITTINAGDAFQQVTPNAQLLNDTGDLLPPMLYSNYKNNNIYSAYELTSKWADKQSNVTRIAAPMSGRNGISIMIEFPANVAFCLAALRLPDFSQGE